MGRRCENYDKFKSTSCEEEQVAMGDLNSKMTGKFYLETNKEKPFGKEKKQSVLDKVKSLLPQ